MSLTKNHMESLRKGKWLLLRIVRPYLGVFLLIMTTTTISCAQSVDEDAKWLIEELNIQQEDVVAEMGSGNGRLTMEVARHVGPSGHVYSSELGADSVQYLQDVVNKAEVSNVTVVEGHPTKTNLPKECCNVLFMRRVYHHFDDPAAMNKSIWQSLKPGGRVAIIDFAPSGTERSDPEERDCSSFEHHGVTKETVVEELKNAGFQLVSAEERSGGDIYVVVQKME
ncbi:class I SAM-dependent methyltransferase [Fodinibius salsisoli]|uniref:Methyltransferase domain-containing protein n=1 Tax=Fodinibius salsisoli TaxID=2820877 RepID=A0ABT3PJW3_9BACT|nr:methyltransferase domain-containing protein [Fodinibius salsisoli]MCW9705474.1 methyltransferase domain-containing protein [Fodinibius salsisoli]